MVKMLTYLPAEVKRKLHQVNEGRVREESDIFIVRVQMYEIC